MSKAQRNRIVTQNRRNAMLEGRVNQLQNYLVGFLNANLWTRLRWLLLGPAFINRKGTAILLAILLGIMVGMVAGLIYLVGRV